MKKPRVNKYICNIFCAYKPLIENIIIADKTLSKQTRTYILEMLNYLDYIHETNKREQRLKFKVYSDFVKNQYETIEETNIKDLGLFWTDDGFYKFKFKKGIIQSVPLTLGVLKQYKFSFNSSEILMQRKQSNIPLVVDNFLKDVNDALIKDGVR